MTSLTAILLGSYKNAITAMHDDRGRLGTPSPGRRTRVTDWIAVVYDPTSRSVTPASSHRASSLFEFEGKRILRRFVHARFRDLTTGASPNQRKADRKDRRRLAVACAWHGQWSAAIFDRTFEIQTLSNRLCLYFRVVLWLFHCRCVYSLPVCSSLIATVWM